MVNGNGRHGLGLKCVGTDPTDFSIAPKDFGAQMSITTDAEAGSKVFV